VGRVSGPIDQPDHFDRTWSTRAGPRAAQSWQSFGKLRKSCDQPEGVRAAHHPLRMAASATDVPVDPLSLRCWSSQKGMEGSSPPPTQPLAHAFGPSTRSSEQVERRSPARRETRFELLRRSGGVHIAGSGVVRTMIDLSFCARLHYRIGSAVGRSECFSPRSEERAGARVRPVDQVPDP
jgi:hypothetical protein